MSPAPHDRRRQGLRAERYVAAELCQAGWELLKQDWRTPYAQVDLLMRSPAQHLVLVEVKSHGPCHWLDGEDLLSPAQRDRLARGAEWLAERVPHQAVRLDLVVVETVRELPVAWQHYPELLLIEGLP